MKTHSFIPIEIGFHSLSNLCLFFGCLWNFRIISQETPRSRTKIADGLPLICAMNFDQMVYLKEHFVNPPKIGSVRFWFWIHFTHHKLPIDSVAETDFTFFSWLLAVFCCTYCFSLHFFFWFLHWETWIVVVVKYAHKIVWVFFFSLNIFNGKIKEYFSITQREANENETKGKKNWGFELVTKSQMLCG